MPQEITKEEGYILKFGGGLNSRASEEDINPRECADGENFTLDAGNFQLRPREPFDLIGTAPNGGSIRGAATLMKQDGTVSTLIQAGDTVYEWTTGSTFVNVGSCSATAQLRGRFEHISQVDDLVIITDLNLIDPVYQWDGTTFSTVSFVDEADGAFGTFKARYCYVSNERAVFANIHDNGSNFPHLIVSSERGDYNQITVTNRPSSALNDQDPWFLVQPDNMYINGMVEGFNQTIFCSRAGNLYRLTGSTAKDFALEPILIRANTSGDEPIALAANDIVYGRQGSLESIRDTEKLGDVESNDLSFWIRDEIEDFKDWTVVSNRRLKRTYFYPNNQGVFYVLYHTIHELNQNQLGDRANNISPWSKWTTQHPIDFNPTLIMPVYDPDDGLEYTIMGDSSGNVYRLEGSGTAGDGGSTAIESFRISNLISAPFESLAQVIDGYVRYRRQSAINLQIKFKFVGSHVFDEILTITLPAPSYDPVYGTTAYYGTTEYYGIDINKLIRQKFGVPGASDEFQIEVRVEDVDDYTINEIGIRWQEAS